MISPNTPTRSVCSAGWSGSPSAPDHERHQRDVGDVVLDDRRPEAALRPLRHEHRGRADAEHGAEATSSARSRGRTAGRSGSVSSVPRSMLRGPMRLAQTALACVCTTALGRLVVPDVNMIPNGSIGSAGRGVHSAASREQRVERARSRGPRSSSVAGSPLLSSVTAIHFSAGAAAATIAAYCGWVIARRRRCARRSRSTSARDRLRVGGDRDRAERWRRPASDSTISGQFSEWISTLSPLAMPVGPRARRRGGARRSSSSA